MAPTSYADVRLCKTDLPGGKRKPINNAVKVLYQKLVLNSAGIAPTQKGTKIARWEEFSQALKASLDKNYGPHWHVMVGTKLGFACKKRNKTMAMYRVGDVMIVLWKSPGIEEEALAEAATAEEENKEGDDAAAESAASMGASLKVLYPQKLEAGCTEELVVATLRDELRTLSMKVAEDQQKLCQALRKRLTADHGTIWHVVVGEEFVAEIAEDRRNHVVASAGKMRIICFQHEQIQGNWNLDWPKILRAIPYLVMVIACLSYLTGQSVCFEEPAPNDKFKWWARNTLCHTDWENKVGYLCVAALVMLFLARVFKNKES